MPLTGACEFAVGHCGLAIGAGGSNSGFNAEDKRHAYGGGATAMRMDVPEANPPGFLPLSLGITFLFDVVVSIPRYQANAGWPAG